MKFRFLAVIVGVVLLVLAAHDVPLAMHISQIERDRLITTLERDAYVLSGRVNAIMATDADALRVQTIALLDQFDDERCNRSDHRQKWISTCVDIRQ